MFNASILYWAISLDNHSRRYSKRVRTVTGLALRRDCVKSECGFSASRSNLMLFPKLIIRYGPVRCPSCRLYLRFLGSKKLYMFHPSFRFHQFHPSKSPRKNCINLSFNWIPILGSGWILLTTWLGPSERRALPYPVQRVEHSDVSMTNGGVIGSLIFPILQTCSHYLPWFSVILGHLWRILFRKSPKVSKFLVRNCKDDLPRWGRNSPLSWGGHCYSRSMAMSPGDYCDGWFFQKGSL